MSLYNNETEHVCLCIPRIENNTTSSDIKNIIDNLSIGSIKRIDIVPTKNKKDKTHKAFIHFHKWYWNERTSRIYNMLTMGKYIKIIYSEPWFWKMSLSKHNCSNNYLVN